MSNWNLRYANDVDEEQDSSMAKFHSRSADLYRSKAKLTSDTTLSRMYQIGAGAHTLAKKFIESIPAGQPGSKRAIPLPGDAAVRQQRNLAASKHARDLDSVIYVLEHGIEGTIYDK